MEGSDSRDRGEGQHSFEARTALFSIAMADCVIVNMWMHDIGRHHAANYELFELIFSQTLRFVTREKHASHQKVSKRACRDGEKLAIRCKRSCESVCVDGKHSSSSTAGEKKKEPFHAPLLRLTLLFHCRASFLRCNVSVRNLFSFPTTLFCSPVFFVRVFSSHQTKIMIAVRDYDEDVVNDFAAVESLLLGDLDTIWSTISDTKSPPLKSLFDITVVSIPHPSYFPDAFSNAVDDFRKRESQPFFPLPFPPCSLSSLHLFLSRL